MIYHVRHINLSENAAFFARGSEGSDIRCEVAPAENEDVFMKHRPNSFFETGLQEALRRQGVTDLVICGMMSQMMAARSGTFATMMTASDYIKSREG